MRPSPPRFQPAGITFLLAAAIIAALLVVNRQYFFHTKAYEYADFAANSLEVLQAKKFQLDYGAYSRWGFHHPGPVLFYLFALGETIFWQDLHWVPTPLNAQVIVVLIVTASFLAAGICAAARWVRSPIFLPLAVWLAALHFSSVRLDYCLFQTWPPFVMPTLFFCLIVVAATVAAGRGGDLPLLVLTGSFVIHSHVAHPLFVLPLFGVAYAGLWWSCRRQGPPTDERGGLPWKVYPRAHWLGLAIAVVFSLPILLDLCRGADSNFALILHHLRTHQGERHPYVDALTYFVKFGAYKVPGTVENSSYHEIVRYLASHPEMFGLWFAALLSPLLALLVRRWRRPGSEDPAAADPRLAGRWRFVGWLSVCLGLTTGLTIFWAHIQDGPMFYYNAWFNYGIYFAYALLGAVAVTDLLESIFARLPRPRLAAYATALLCVVLVGVTYWSRPDRFVSTLGKDPVLQTLAATVSAALAEHPDAPRTKFLDVPNALALGAGPAVAILLKRDGDDFRVRPEWKTMFGYTYALGDDYPNSLVEAQQKNPMELWRVVKPGPASQAAASRPLMDGFALEVGSTEINPAKAPAIVLVGPRYNGTEFCMMGIDPPLPGGDYVLTSGKVGLLHFAAAPIPAGGNVEIHFDFFAALLNARHPVQRLKVRLNGVAVGAFVARWGAPSPDLSVRVPAALWNAARSTTFLTLDYPDAVAPADIDEVNKDTRVIAFGAKEITFRLAEPVQPANPPP